jgi:carboxypeptidase family protein
MVPSVSVPRTAQFRHALALFFHRAIRITVVTQHRAGEPRELSPAQEKTMRALLVLALGCMLAGCGGSSSPNTPTPPVNLVNTWNLTGTVSSSTGGGISGATVVVVDGPDLGKQATADSAGRYSFSGLQQAGFSVRASASSYTPATRGVTLTANMVADFQLTRQLAAALTFEGPITFTPRADGAYDMSATGGNGGDGCAGSVTGTTTLTPTSGSPVMFVWSLPSATVIRVGERFRYSFGPITASDFMAYGTDGTYVTRFTFTNVLCP